MKTHRKATPVARVWALGLVAWLVVPGPASARENAEPQTRIVQGPARVTLNRLAEFVFESDEPRASFECSLNSERFFACENPLRLYSRIQLGERYTLKVRARLGERVDSTPASYTWRTLRELPWQPVITEPAPGDFVEGRMLHVAGLASPGGRLRVLLDGEPVAGAQADTRGEWSLSVPVEAGLHTLLAELEDGAGEAIVPTEPVVFTMQAIEVGGCASTGGAPALLLIGLVALAIMSNRRRCSQESPVSSRGCDCCR